MQWCKRQFQVDLIWTKGTVEMNRSSLVLSLGIGIVATIEANAQQCDHDFSRPYYKTRGSYCTVGQLVDDQYAVGRKVKCEDVEVDHLVSLYYAYKQGICGDDLRRLANDPRNLRFTHRGTNRSKGSKSPEEFASSLPDVVATRVMSDADVLRSEYGLGPISDLSDAQRTGLLVEELEANKSQIRLLAAVNPGVRAKVVRYKDRQMPLADAVDEHTTAVRRRLVTSAQRNFGAMPAEALPWFGMSVILAATAWEVFDLCEALKDNHELAVAFNPGLKLSKDVTQVCATHLPSREELFEQIVAAPGDVWTVAQETYSDIEATAPTMSDLGGYLATAKTATAEFTAQTKSGSKSLWEKARQKLRSDNDEPVER